MAKSNRDRIGEVMDMLRDGLGPFTLREYKAYYKQTYSTEINATLSGQAYTVPPEVLESDDSMLKGIDTQGWLNLMARRYIEIFKDKLGQNPRNYVGELVTARNDWAHQKPITSFSAQRIADTAYLLLSAIGATLQAQSVSDIKRELGRLAYEEEAKQSTKKASTPAVDNKTEEIPAFLTQAGLKPWRLVVKPHNDVATGRYIQAEFAADLAQVVSGKAEPEYGDPKEFFRRTYLTEGLISLLATGLKRLTGNGGDPVVQLQTSFGGGKTHSMLALYHLCGGKIRLSEIPGGEKIVSQVGTIDDTMDAHRAVIVGTAFSASEPRRYKDVTTNTLWGEIAYQLGGAEAYKIVERSDVAGISPGSDTLVELLEKHGPALIIIDELVAFARNLYGNPQRVAAGTFESLMTFIQALTEAVKRASDAILLISIPVSERFDDKRKGASSSASEIEIGGEAGRSALEILKHTIGRLESVWKPVTATESFEIVRRRLFSTEMDFAARDATVNAFRKMYRDQSADFPTGVAEAEYAERLKAAYPIHPEFFDRLYQDWSTLERFQRTRGVLRLMAAVIHQLWINNDAMLLIMPGSVPLGASSVRNEMTRYLPEEWSAVLDIDIDGDGSRPLQIDKSVPMLAQYSACRRVARSIFVGSAPTVTGQAARGLEEIRIRLAVVQPGEQVGIFSDALRRMSNVLTYLYSDNSRYWYDTRPTVNRMAQDRAKGFPLDSVYKEIVDWCHQIKVDKAKFAAAHIVPDSSADIYDEPRARVVVLDPSQTHKRANDQSEAMLKARDYLMNRGTSPRIYRNMLVFIAPDAVDGESLEKAMRDRMAWASIQEEQGALNLDEQQRKQVEANRKRAEQTVTSRLQEAYSWLIVPVQNDPTGNVELQAIKISGAESYFDRAYRKLRQSEQIINRWSPDNLRIELDRFLWRDQPHIKIKQLWEYLAQYCYLPRLADQDVLNDAIQEGLGRLTDEPFAYATLAEADGTYKGLVWHKAGVKIYANESDVLVHPDAARSQEAKARVKVNPPVNPQPPDGGDGTSGGGTQTTPPQPPEPEPSKVKPLTRYYATVQVDSRRVNGDVGTIVNEIIEHLTGKVGTQVTITLEISASRAAGFDEDTVRTLNENSRTLKFKNHGFETE